MWSTQSELIIPQTPTQDFLKTLQSLVERKSSKSRAKISFLVKIWVWFCKRKYVIIWQFIYNVNSNWYIIFLFNNLLMISDHNNVGDWFFFRGFTLWIVPVPEPKYTLWPGMSCLHASAIYMVCICMFCGKAFLNPHTMHKQWYVHYTFILIKFDYYSKN